MEITTSREIVLREVARHVPGPGDEKNAFRSAGCVIARGVLHHAHALELMGLLRLARLRNEVTGRLVRVWTLTAAGWRALEELPDDASVRCNLR